MFTILFPAVSTMMGMAVIPENQVRENERVQIVAPGHDVRWAPVRFGLQAPLPNGTWFLALPDGLCLPLQQEEIAGGEWIAVTVVPALAANKVVDATFVTGPLPGVDSPISGKVEVRTVSPVRTVVRVGGELFTAYHHDPQEKKPFFFPLLGPDRRRMTRSFPMEEVAGEPRDHPHHRSLWVAYGDVNGTDCWSQGEGTGWQAPRGLRVSGGPVYGVIRAANTWLDRDRSPIVAEERTFVFYNTPASLRIIDASVTFVARYGPVKFGDTKEGGIIALRVNPAINATDGGTLINARGDAGTQAWGKAAEWVDNSGTIDGTTCGIAVFDTPGNLRYPTTWHARDYGLIGANCFGLSHFTGGRANGDYSLGAGEQLTFRYRLIVHQGDAAQADIGARYLDYVDPPRVN